MADIKKAVKKESKTKYKVLGFTIGGVVVSTIAFLAIRAMHKDSDQPENTSVPETKKNVISKIIKKPAATSSTTSTAVVNTPAPIPPAATVATITQATAASLAEALRRATYIREKDDYGKNWGLLLGSLGMIKNVKDYTLVNNVFLQVSIPDRILNSAVSMSIVTKTMSGFGQYNAYNRELTKQFIRIGLKQSTDGKWSLNGLGSL